MKLHVKVKYSKNQDPNYDLLKQYSMMCKWLKATPSPPMPSMIINLKIYILVEDMLVLSDEIFTAIPILQNDLT